MVSALERLSGRALWDLTCSTCRNKLGFCVERCCCHWPPEGRTLPLNYHQPRANKELNWADLHSHKSPFNLSRVTSKVAEGKVLFTWDPPAAALQRRRKQLTSWLSRACLSHPFCDAGPCWSWYMEACAPYRCVRWWKAVSETEIWLLKSLSEQRKWGCGLLH